MLKTRGGSLNASGEASRNSLHRDAYIVQRDLVNTLIRQAKEQYYREQIEECGSDQKKLYQVMNSLLQRKKSPVLPTRASPAVLAAEFNEFFQSKILRLRSELDKHDTCTSEPQTDFDEPEIKLECFSPGSVEEYKKVIMSSPSKTCSLDPLPTWILKNCVDSLLPMIMDIVNSSLVDGVCPVDFKNAVVTPLLKKSTLDPAEFKNYRPVSGLSFVSKVAEKLVANRLKQHIQQSNLLDPHQSAYRTSHSTETALLKVQNDILRAIDDGFGVFLVLLDLSAAFDTIDHGILITRLHDMGVRGTALNWLSTYLTDRTQSVIIDGVCSQPSELQYGVPQGSVLGPILFTLYTPIGHIARQYGLNVHLYADDTQVYATFKMSQPSSQQTCVQLLQQCLADISRWMVVNKLHLNPNKTEFLVMCAPRQRHKICVTELNVAGTLVTSVASARNLGVWFDNSFNMVEHLNQVFKGALVYLHLIKSVRNSIDQPATEKLVHAFITSRLDYCNSLLVNLPKSHLMKLQSVQNMAARVISRKRKYDHISPVLQALHWLPVCERIQYKILLRTYQALHNLAPPYVKDMLSSGENDHTMSLRSSSNQSLTVPRTRMVTYGDRTFSSAAPRLWNMLPNYIKNANSLCKFKTLIKTHLYKKAFLN